jgi:hypothetical protein
MSTFTGTPNGRGCEAAKGSGTVFVGSQKNYKKYAEKGKEGKGGNAYQPPQPQIHPGI